MATKRNTVTDGATQNPTPQTYPAQVAEEVDPLYEELKAQFGVIHVLEVETEDGQIKRSYLRKPGFATRRDVLAVAMKSDEDFDNLMRDMKTVVAMGDIILAQCYVGGENFLLDEDAHLEAAGVAASLFESKTVARLKKN